LDLVFQSFPAQRYIMLNEVSVSDRATTQGIITVFISIGQMTGSAAIGTLIASNKVPIIGYKNVFFIISLLALLLAASGFLLKNRSKELMKI
jgi:MFS family permease